MQRRRLITRNVKRHRRAGVILISECVGLDGYELARRASLTFDRQGAIDDRHRSWTVDAGISGERQSGLYRRDLGQEHCGLSLETAPLVGRGCRRELLQGMRFGDIERIGELALGIGREADAFPALT